VWHVLVGTSLGLVLVWLTLAVLLYRASRRDDDPATLRDAARLGPDVVRLVRRLAMDPQLPRGVRWRLTALLVYLVSPVDLIPDFIPVIGFADDAVILALTLRSVVRVAGGEALDRHWPGAPHGLTVLKRLARVQG
jgi:uncharacterized membrane protein YkvA (DUF1232 family)